MLDVTGVGADFGVLGVSGLSVDKVVPTVDVGALLAVPNQSNGATSEVVVASSVGTTV